MMQLSDTERAISEEEFSKFESGFSRKLPASLKAHYLRNNGVFPDSNYVKGSKHVFSIDGFIPIKYGVLPIERLVRDMRAPEPDGYFLPFANDAGGNIFYISLLDDDYERVYLLTADTAEKIYVCGSFDEFIAALYNE